MHTAQCIAFTCQIEDELEYQTDKNDSISPMNQLLITLRFYATGTFQLVIGDLFDIHKSTVCRIVHKVTSAIAKLCPKYVKFPMSAEERRNEMNQVYLISGLPGVIGAIDCTHVPIQSPGGQDAEIYRNRKGQFSVNVQLICDSRGCISDVVARWPGSVHDSTVFDNSRIRALLETGPTDGYLIGDNGYPCRRYLLTPVTNPANDPERKYNEAHISARNCIERANGILKRRFPALKYGLRLKLKHTLPVIVAAVVVNNIALIAGDQEPPADEELSEFLEQMRKTGVQVNYDPVEVGPPTGHLSAASTSMRQAVIDSHFTV